MVLWNVVQDLPTGLQSLVQVREQSGTFIPVTQALWSIIDSLVRNLDALLKVVQVSELQEPFVQMYRQITRVSRCILSSNRCAIDDTSCNLDALIEIGKIFSVQESDAVDVCKIT
ncbi:hypothetical protein QX201_004200 [Fusarium graminearum]